MEPVLENDPTVWELLEAIARLEDPQECARFFRDLCTVTEIRAMAERWQVARLIARDIPYRQISQQTGASTATISRIAHWVKYGEGGYLMMVERAAGRASRGEKKEIRKKKKEKREKRAGEQGSRKRGDQES